MNRAEARPEGGGEVLRVGRGGAPALFVHAALARARAWYPVMQRLGDCLSATAFDLPGHGGDAPENGRDDPQGRATERAAGLCAARTDVVGHSFGATVALRLAVERPDLVRRLVLVEPVLFAAVRGTPAFDAYRESHRTVEACAALGDPEGAARAFLALWGADARGGMPASDHSRAARRMGIVAAMTGALENDAGRILPRLGRLAVPVLLIRGAATQPVIPAIHAALAERIGDVRHAVVPGAAHMSPVTHPAEVAALIGAHLGA